MALEWLRHTSSLDIRNAKATRPPYLIISFFGASANPWLPFCPGPLTPPKPDSKVFMVSTACNLLTQLRAIFSIYGGTFQGTDDSTDQTASGRISPMNTSDRFLRFAAECEAMAKFTRSPESRRVWSGLAQRWQRCAELMDHQDSNRDGRRSLKRYPKVVHGSAH
jgi:hypothetical protein